VVAFIDEAFTRMSRVVNRLEVIVTERLKATAINVAMDGNGEAALSGRYWRQRT
jgi:hypothetical protein